MEKSVNIAIIGMGKWGNHLLENIIRLNIFNVKYICCRKKEDVKLKTDATIISDEDLILNDDAIEGIIIATQPEKHLQSASKFLKKGLKVFIEKPLALSYKDCKDFDNILKQKPSSGIMVGNKFVYSLAINNLKTFISENNIQIKSISSRWLKGGGIQTSGILFDIAYHHIYLFNYLLGKQFDNLKKFILNKDGKTVITAAVILKYGDLMCSIESSYNNHFDFFDHSIRIETNKGTFIIKEENRKISIYFDNKGTSSLSFKYYENRETCVEEELLAYYKWIANEKELKFGPENDFKIIKFLEE
jgi:predicted dehydrogenase